MSPADVAELSADMLALASSLILLRPFWRDTRRKLLVDRLRKFVVSGKGGAARIDKKADQVLQEKAEAVGPEDIIHAAVGLSLLLLGFVLKLLSWVLPDGS